MLKKYTGSHYSLDNLLESADLTEIKSQLNTIMGEEKKDYTTAWITEYGIMGRQVAQHYFSIKDNKWHRSTNPITMYRSWHDAVNPIGNIARYLLWNLGFAEKEKAQMEEDINKIRESI